jgi:hypothetical protein
MSPLQLQQRVAESIANHEPLVIRRSFPFGIDVRYLMCQHIAASISIVVGDALPSTWSESSSRTAK